ncbi:MAG: cell division protein FtsQ/DivIB [Anaerolineales bacterium]
MTPTHQRTHSRTRRRYDVALGVPGAELRLPALPSVRVSWRLASGLMVVLLLGLLYNFQNAPRFRVNGVQATGLERLSDREVSLVLGLTDTPVFLLDPAQMQRDLLEAFPEFSSASVWVDWPNVVNVAVEERQPVLVWKSAGKTVWVDAEGIAFPQRGKSAPAALVEAAGIPPAPSPEGDDPLAPHRMMTAELVSAILAVSELAPEETILLYDPKRGLGWKDPQGWQVYFGPDGVDMEQKLKVYRALVTRLLEEDIYPALISVEYLHAPYYRLDQ